MFYFTSDIWHNELELWFSKPHLSLISNIWSGKTGKKFTHWKEELLLPYSKIYDPHKRKLKWATESMTEPWQMFLAHRPLNLCPYALSSAKKTTKTTTTKNKHSDMNILLKIPCICCHIHLSYVIYILGGPLWLQW